MVVRLSTVFRAKRDTLLVTIRSILPASASPTMRLKPSRFRVLQPVMPTPTGRTNWQNSTVKSILTNEKYKGDALLQKTITVDFLSKAHKVNEGDAPQFFVENSHPAIISREVYDLVQLELQRRGKRGRHTSAKSIFSDRLICGECGAAFGSKVWHSTDPYRKVSWRCHQK